jgi:hypothetical protein
VNSGGTAQSAVVSGAVRCNARAAFCGAAQSGEVGFAASGGMAMNSGFDRFELSEIAGPGIAGPASGHFWGRSGTVPTRYFSFVWLPTVLIAGLGAWMLLSGYVSKPAES